MSKQCRFDVYSKDVALANLQVSSHVKDSTRSSYTDLARTVDPSYLIRYLPYRTTSLGRSGSSQAVRYSTRKAVGRRKYPRVPCERLRGKASSFQSSSSVRSSYTCGLILSSQAHAVKRDIRGLTWYRAATACAKMEPAAHRELV
jgi:hypothetical protein